MYTVQVQHSTHKIPTATHYPSHYIQHGKQVPAPLPRSLA